MAKRRIYEVENGNGVGFCTNFGTNRKEALDRFNYYKRFCNNVYLKSYDLDGYSNEKILKEFHH